MVCSEQKVGGTITHSNGPHALGSERIGSANICDYATCGVNAVRGKRLCKTLSPEAAGLPEGNGSLCCGGAHLLVVSMLILLLL